MIWAAVAFTFGQLAFVSQELPGLRGGPPDSLTGAPQLNCRFADLNADNAQDIVLREGVYLQRPGRGDFDNLLLFPAEAAAVQIDVWGDTAYFAGAGALRLLQVRAGEWHTVHQQKLDWPPPTRGQRTASELGDVGSLDGFLHDFDSDGIPELVALTVEGAHIFTRNSEGAYAARGVLRVLPPPTIRPLQDVALWPPEARTLALPPRQILFRCYFEGSVFAVVERSGVGSGDVVWRTTRYALDPESGWSAALGAPSVEQTPPLPHYLAPCRLNDGAMLDFAGGEWRLSETGVLPRPLYETAASIDGQPLTIRRTHVVRPRTHFADVDHDKKLDIVAEFTGMYEGGVRETLTRFLSAREFSHRVEVYRQLDGSFESAPFIQGELTIELETPPIYGGAMFEQYRRGELFDLTGDFDGDGVNDLCVRQAADELAVYLTRDNAIGQEPAKVWGLPQRARFCCADVNGDGCVDVILRWPEESPAPRESSVVHLSQRAVAP